MLCPKRMMKIIVLFLVILTVVVEAGSSQGRCVSPPSDRLNQYTINTIVFGNVISITKRNRFVRIVEIAVTCRFRYPRNVGDRITIFVGPVRRDCLPDLAIGNELIFYLSDTSDPTVFSTVVHPQFDSFASISEVDVSGLRQYSYTSGIMPSGSFCPEDCVTGSQWSEWTKCSEHCGPGYVTRNLQISENKLKSKTGCPTVLESAHCYLKPCYEVFDPLNNENRWTDTYMILGNCQTVQPVRHLLCTQLCVTGFTNNPVSWSIKPERVICELQTVKFKAVMVITACSCQEDDEVIGNPLDFLDW